jgi:WD40 repeat protein
MGWSIMRIKGSPPCVESLVFGRHPDHGDIIAVATDGRVRIFSLPEGKELSAPSERAIVITSVALGRISGEDVLVTGSMGGVLIVWDLATNRRIAALTLDKGIDCVWCVHGANSVAAKARTEIYVLDVVPGTESL